MSDYYSIQEIGGAELARHYPDRGQIHDCHWYNATLQIESTSNGWRDWLKSLSVGNQGFIAVLSAGNDGLRVLVSLYEFAIFIPWADATVFAERGWPATVVRLKTIAVPSLTLVFNLDDAAADDRGRVGRGVKVFEYVGGQVPPAPAAQILGGQVGQITLSEQLTVAAEDMRF